MIELFGIISLILIQILTIYLGISIHWILLFALPVSIFMAWLLTVRIEYTLALFFTTALIKGYLIEMVPVFKILDITVMLILFLWTAVLFKWFNKKITIRKDTKSFLFFLLIFILYFALSYLFTPSPKYGIQKFTSFAIITSSLIITPVLLLDQKLKINNFTFALYIITIVSSLIIFSQMLFSFIRGEFLQGLLFRFTILGSNPIGVARIISLGISMTLILFLNDPRHRLFFGTLLMIMFPALIATGSRGPVFSLVVGAFTYILIFDTEYRKKIVQYSFIFILVMGLFLILLPENITSRFFFLSSNEVVLTGSGISRVSTIDTRLNFWSMAIENLMSNGYQFLTGFGSGSFSNLFIYRDFQWYPHNMIIEVFYEQGLIGLSILVLMLFYPGIKVFISFMNYKTIPIALKLLTISTLILFFSALFSGDINDNRLFWLLLSTTFIYTTTQSPKLILHEN